MTTYPLTAEDREIQDRTRRFVEEDLIPWEQHAEEHDGAIPAMSTRRTGGRCASSASPR